MSTAPTAAPLGGMPVEEFLSEYWQKKPCLIRQAFRGFVPQLDENDIAGLACDELAEARLVQGSVESRQWTVEHGPFQDSRLAGLPESNWCLLVQDVEKHYPPLQELLQQFDFLPRWRLDDLMVSVSAPGGSVGPHVDQYDVFLLQASGQRRWQVAESFDPELVANTDLRVLQHFEPEQEWVLQAGDMLYLPPGIAHYGLALDLGMTWSIGLRAPSQADLFQALGDWLAEHHTEGQRYADPGLQPAQRPGEISQLDLQGLAGLFVVAGLPPDDLNQFLASFLCRFRLAHQPAALDTPLDRVGLFDARRSGYRLAVNPWTRLNWIDREPDHAAPYDRKERDQQAWLFAPGYTRTTTRNLAMALCGNRFPEPELERMPPQELDTVLELLNLGHLYLEAPED